MASTRKIVATGIAASALLLALGGSAGAADNDSTTVQLALQGGFFNLDVSGDPTAVTTLSQDGGVASLNFADTDTFTGTLPTVTVTDERREAAASWAVEVQADAAFREFDTTTSSYVTDGATIDASQGLVYFDAADLTALQSSLSGLLNGMTITGGQVGGFDLTGASDLETGYNLIQGQVVGLTSFLNLTEAPSLQYTPKITVEVPAGTPAGTYRTTITQTAS